MNKTRINALILLLAAIFLGYFIYSSEMPGGSFYKPFKLGLDLSGGSRLTYIADTSKLNPTDVSDAMSSLREVIDRRVNVFGVSEPIVQVERSVLGGGEENRLIIELPGVSNVDEAAKMISATPSLEFKTERATGTDQMEILQARKDISNFIQANASTTSVANLEALVSEKFGSSTLALAQEDPEFISSGLTGRYLKKAQVSFGQDSLSPSISIEFNSEGAALFDKITKENVNKRLAIYLDGNPISAPVVREEIRDGKAEISGQFTVEEAKTLARNLNLGALPVPIKLASTEIVGATLGGEATRRGVEAGLIGLLIVAIFMVAWYRLPGLVAVVALAVYITIVLAIFKLLPVTLTAAGIAGFILSIGIAVDANVLIFERMREEIALGKGLLDSIKEGFNRAWTSVRDSNVSSIISAVILFWFGTSLIKGFALTLIIGILVSMFTAIVVSRTFLMALGFRNRSGVAKFLFDSRFFKN